MIKASKSIGVLMFFVGRSWATDEEIVALFSRIAENVSFALDNFDRAAEKARADEATQSLTRMYAALSATNEAIMRAKTRTELTNWSARRRPRAAGSTPPASCCRGPTAIASISWRPPGRRPAMRGGCRFPPARPIRRAAGVCGTAYRTRQASLSNDFANDPRGTAFKQVIQSDGARSGAAFPLLVDDQCAGVMLFISSELDTFTPEFAELLQRLADNVSFALGNFDRADEKAHTEEQKESLARMLAALSATNEAIVRAKSRDELFELVCEAAAQGGKFTSTNIALVRPDSDFLDIVAVAGPTAAGARDARISINEAHPEGRGLAGTAFRSRQARISNDYLAESDTAAFHARPADGSRSGAAFPLLVDGEVVGIMLFHLGEEEHLHAANSSSCCSGSPPTSPLRWRISTVPTRRRAPSEQRERPDPHVCGAERDQRSDRARQDRARAVRTGVRSRGARRQVHLDQRSEWCNPTATSLTSWLRPVRPPPARARPDFEPARPFRRDGRSPARHSAPGYPVSSTTISRIRTRMRSMRERALMAPSRGLRSRCSSAAARSASWCCFAPRKIRSRRNSSKCCNGSSTTSPLRWKTSTAPTRRRAPSSSGSGCPACLRR